MVIGSPKWGGDEGKGKIVDYLAQKADVVIRSQVGITPAVRSSSTIVLCTASLLPSDPLFSDKTCIIGSASLSNPKVLLEEIEGMTSKGVQSEQIKN